VLRRGEAFFSVRRTARCRIIIWKLNVKPFSGTTCVVNNNVGRDEAFRTNDNNCWNGTPERREKRRHVIEYGDRSSAPSRATVRWLTRFANTTARGRTARVFRNSSRAIEPIRVRKRRRNFRRTWPPPVGFRVRTTFARNVDDRRRPRPRCSRTCPLKTPRTGTSRSYRNDNNIERLLWPVNFLPRCRRLWLCARRIRFVYNGRAKNGVIRSDFVPTFVLFRLVFSETRNRARPPIPYDKNARRSPGGVYRGNEFRSVHFGLSGETTEGETYSTRINITPTACRFRERDYVRGSNGVGDTWTTGRWPNHECARVYSSCRNTKDANAQVS